MRYSFFSAGYFFPRYQAVGRIFFSEITHSLIHSCTPSPPPRKVKCSAPLTLFGDYFKTLRQSSKLEHVSPTFSSRSLLHLHARIFFRLSFRSCISCVYNNCDVLLSRFVSSFRSSNIWHSYNHPQFQLMLQIKFLMFTRVPWVC